MASLPDIEVYNAAEDCRLEQVEKTKHIPGAVITLVIQPMSHSTIEACNARGGNPMGLDPRGQQCTFYHFLQNLQEYFLTVIPGLLAMTDWNNDEDETALLEASRQIIDRAETVAKKNDTFLGFKYLNYASKDQNPLASYGTENLAKLKSIASSFDPAGVFQRLQNDGFLISKVD